MDVLQIVSYLLAENNETYLEFHCRFFVIFISLQGLLGLVTNLPGSALLSPELILWCGQPGDCGLWVNIGFTFWSYLKLGSYLRWIAASLPGATEYYGFCCYASGPCISLHRWHFVPYQLHGFGWAQQLGPHEVHVSRNGYNVMVSPVRFKFGGHCLYLIITMPTETPMNSIFSLSLLRKMSYEQLQVQSSIAGPTWTHLLSMKPL